MVRNISRKAGLLVLLAALTWVAEVGAEMGADKPSEDAKNPYALTIAGGISLGVYEAGLNWIIVDTLRDKFTESGEKEFRLDTVTGASAGAINTLVSAIRFCEMEEPGKNHKSVYNNLFKDTWINVDANELLSEKNKDFNQLQLDLGKEKKRPLKDSLFSRKVFSDIIDELRRSVKDGQYREGMKIKLAFTVTRSKPLETRIKTTIGTQKIHSQRFAIPLIAETERITRNGKSEVGLFFKNNIGYKPQNGKDMEHLFLPQSEGYVEFDQVARAVLASSAFPFAFSRVELAYCERAKGTDLSDSGPSGTCPAGYEASSGFFIDGGTFDNVPLGLAVELIEQPEQDKDKKINFPATYIYMDPANRRSVAEQLNDTKKDEGSLVLEEQLKAWVPAFGTLMNGELYRTLLEKFNTENSDNTHRALLLTRRFPPLTGNFLGHFGAFFDPSFRRYDYSVGVYDGLMNATDYLYYLDPTSGPITDPGIVSAKKAEIFLSLAKKHLDFKNAKPEDREIHQLIKAFLEWEKVSPAWNEAKEFFPEAKDASASYAVFEAITKVDESDFNGFLEKLEPNKKAVQRANTTHD